MQNQGVGDSLGANVTEIHPALSRPPWRGHVTLVQGYPRVSFIYSEIRLHHPSVVAYQLFRHYKLVPQDVLRRPGILG